MRAILVLLLAMAPLLAAASHAHGQGDECNSVFLPRYERMPDGTTFLQGPFLFRCTNGAELRADQGTAYPTGEIVLTGSVQYDDADRSLTADQATYSRPIRRLYATGNVNFTNRAEGMSIRGPELEYFAEMPGRPEAQVNAGQRPHLTLQPRDGDADDEPLEIDADRITILGENDLSAFGSVVIKRPDLDATAEEARYDGDGESLELRQNAVVKGENNTLRGAVIQAQLPGNELRDVRARTGAVLESEDLTVTAPDVQLLFREERVERAIARGSADAPAERPVAVSRNFRLVADSIDAITPEQRLEQVIAIGRARAETKDTTTTGTAAPPAGQPRARPVATDTAAAGAQAADTAAAPGPSAASLLESDWLLGDTIIGYFARPDSAAGEAADSSAQLERLVARGSAQSLYKVQQDDDAPEAGAQGADREPGVSFVAADVITVRMKNGEVDVTEVSGLYGGVYLDPAPPQATPPAPPPAPGRE